MVTEIYATGKTINEAIDALKAKLCVSDLDGTEWKVVSVGKKGGLFGLGAQPAKVVAFIEAKEEEKPAPKAESKPDAKAEAKPAPAPARSKRRRKNPAAANTIIIIRKKRAELRCFILLPPRHILDIQYSIPRRIFTARGRKFLNLLRSKRRFPKNGKNFGHLPRFFS